MVLDHYGRGPLGPYGPSPVIILKNIPCSNGPEPLKTAPEAYSKHAPGAVCISNMDHTVFDLQNYDYDWSRTIRFNRSWTILSRTGPCGLWTINRDQKSPKPSDQLWKNSIVFVQSCYKRWCEGNKPWIPLIKPLAWSSKGWSSITSVAHASPQVTD